jgi:hypothetical protein
MPRVWLRRIGDIAGIYDFRLYILREIAKDREGLRVVQALLPEENA